MRRTRVLPVCLACLLLPGLSSGADRGALFGDSLLRMECERNQNRLTATREAPAQLISASVPRQGEPGQYRPWAEDAPPFRKQGAEPLLTVFLWSGSTIRADKTWVKEDRLFYFSRGVKGSVPVLEVNRLEDLRDKLRKPHRP